MRNRILQRAEWLLRNYVWFVAAAWAIFTLFPIVMGLVLFPTTQGSVWYFIAGSTLGCICALAFFGILKSLFYKRVVSALAAHR